MRRRDTRYRGIGSSGKPALVTDTVVLIESDVAGEMKSHEGDVLYGLRIGLAISAVLWVAIICAGFVIFN